MTNKLCLVFYYNVTLNMPAFLCLCHSIFVYILLLSVLHVCVESVSASLSMELGLALNPI